ncbi:MAG: DNA polymerase I [Spirochaetes bacterium ADurb.Bin001]|nr:MAG: DNA polymerase I [Spirochaetes bacterium ADurb.Bin001]
MTVKVAATLHDAYELIHKGVLALARAERQGIRIDVDYCLKQKEKLTKKIDHYQKKLQATKFYRRWDKIYQGKVNIHSNTQLSNILYKHMKIDPPKVTDSGQGATDEEALKRINIPELKYIIKIRKWAKIRDTYLESFLRETNKDGYMRPNFNLHIVRTYRSSSSDPNFQNIPKRDKKAMEICRRAILPRPGHLLLEADFSALEVMISACYHKDPTMLNYLRNKDSDMHGDMAKQIFFLNSLDKSLPPHKTLRQAAKNGFVFPQFYGDYYKNNAIGICDWIQLPINQKWTKIGGIELPEGRTIAEQLHQNKIKSFDDFVEHIKGVEDHFWNKRFSVYKQWKEDLIAEYRRKGYLQMYTGFICSGVMRKNEITNYPIQGSAFHCLLKTFTKVDERMREENWKSRLIGQIHDSMIMDVDPKELDHIQETQNHIVKVELPKEWPWIIVPLEIEADVYGVNQPWVK